MSELPSTFFGNDIETDGVFVILRRLVLPVSETTKEERDAGKIEIVEHYVGAVRKAFQTAGL